MTACPLWIPRYNTQPPIIPWDCWQYTDARPPFGIDGNVTHHLDRLLIGAGPTTPTEEDDMFSDADRKVLYKLAERDERRSLRCVKAADHDAVFLVTVGDGPARWWVPNAHLLGLFAEAYGFDPTPEVWAREQMVAIPVKGDDAPGFAG